MAKKIPNKEATNVCSFLFKKNLRAFFLSHGFIADLATLL